MRLAQWYPIGTPLEPWGAPELAQWRAAQSKQRSYVEDVLVPLQSRHEQFDLLHYGEVLYAHERYELIAARSQKWQSGSPLILITGGVHGYETSGVQGALRFLWTHAHQYVGDVNMIVVPCVSPWAYERIQRWNFDAIDPNRSFFSPSPAQECSALLKLVIPFLGQFTAHIDLHETTDTDESEFRPALAARDGKVFEPGHIPDGFYLVDDGANPQPAFQQAIISAVRPFTHIAANDEKGYIIGSPVVMPGVICYELKSLSLCTSVTNALYTTTTEVYPNSRSATPEQCIEAQLAAICGALDFLNKSVKLPV